jgi:hypothetical protein
MVPVLNKTGTKFFFGGAGLKSANIMKNRLFHFVSLIKIISLEPIWKGYR